MKKLFFIEDKKNIKSRTAATELKQRYADITAARLRDADTVVVLGGDGFLLRTLPGLLKMQKSVFGLNLGHVGALMNPYIQAESNLPDRIAAAQAVTLHPLEAECLDWNANTKSVYAFNEVCLKTQKPQMAHLGLIKTPKPKKQAALLPGQVLAHTIYGDGVMVATPIGSTAYYAQAGGKPFSLTSGKIGIRSICAVPDLCVNHLVPDTMKITVSVDDFIRRPVMMTADSKTIRNVVQCRIKVCTHQSVTLLLDQNRVRS